MSLIYTSNNDKNVEQYDNFMKEWKLNEKIEAKDFLKDIEILFFDCDGVLWHGNKVLDGVLNVIEKLLVHDKKKVYFITNDSTKSRQTFLKKFHALGFTFVKMENIICTAYGVSKYLYENENFSKKKKKIYVIGEKGICDELDFFNLSWIGSYQHKDKKVILDDNISIDVDENIGAVVVGMDFNINYYKIQYAQLCLNQLNADFIATNKDALGNFNSIQKWAGTGSIVSSIEAVTTKKPFIIGKPNIYMINNLLNELKIDKSKIVMIGDRLDTDIDFSHNCEIKSILVSTGVTDSNVYFNHNPKSIKPNYFMISVADLY